MHGIFAEAHSFHGTGLETWNVASVKDMSYMFFNTRAPVVVDLSNWDTSRVTTFESMFENTWDVFHPIMHGWDISSATDMSMMFRNSFMRFHFSMEDWNVEKVENIDEIFHYTVFFDQNISRWNVASVTSMNKAFDIVPLLSNCVKRRIYDLWEPLVNIQTWPYPDWANYHADNDCEVFDCGSDTNLIPDCTHQHCAPLTLLNDGFCDDGSQYQFDLRCYLEETPDCNDNSTHLCSPDYIVDCSGTRCCEERRIGDGNCDDDTSNSDCDLTCYGNGDGGDCECPENTVQDCSGDHLHCVEKSFLGDGECDDVTRPRGFDLSCYNEDESDCEAPAECPDFTNRDVLYDSVTRWIELGDRAATDHPCGLIGEWDVSKVEDFSQLFCGDPFVGCLTDRQTFNDDISNWNVASATSFNGMFHGAYAFNGDVSNFQTRNVVDMTDAFRHAVEFQGIGIERWDTSSVMDMSGMFLETRISRGVERWDTSKVRNFDWMFASAEEFEGDVSAWNVASATSIAFMFSKAILWNSDLSEWGTYSYIFLFSLSLSLSLSLK